MDALRANEPVYGMYFGTWNDYYLMSRKNSKYYPDVHWYYSLLTEMSNHVTDWGNIPSDVAFTDRFNMEFGNRRTYWG